ncbi:ABC transporter permease [Pseudoscardovia radai]|uniref:ABC transporter permease n=1 Tax=Pseudoscardovia radai TaxID=987066 RepID=A0A261ESF2_9BIFI|nr:FtsX-like permease family protein [Pseudoscardovia radai]OZG49787.1 ABC transporter permease [Pseudoscardovia radai]
MSPVVTIGVRDARAHASRFVMSIVAIALGVAFVLGSFCFRGLLDGQVRKMTSTNADGDVYVQGLVTEDSDDSSASAEPAASSSSSSSDDDTDSRNNIDVSLVSTISAVDGVQTAVPARSLDGVVLVNSDGVAASSMTGTSANAMSEEYRWRSAHFVQGGYPHGEHEVALSSDTASSAGLAYGSQAKIVYPSAGVQDVTVTGIFDLDDSQAGALVLGLDPDVVISELQAQGTSTDTIPRIKVYGSANGGAALTEKQQQDLADAINAALPADSQATAVTGQSHRDELNKSYSKQLGFIQPLILIFAVLALFVGSFIIANTFTMIVRDSMRGYALLRSIGVSPGQVFATVIIQALLLGLVGSGIGVVLGWGIVEAIVAILAAQGTPFTASAAPTVPIILLAFAVGIAVSLLGATLPARRAALAPPIQAMNETTNPEPPVTRRAIGGIVLALLGGLCWWFALAIAHTSDTAAGPTPWPALNGIGVGWPLGVGAGLLVVGVIMLAPALVRPFGAVLGWLPAHAFRVTGRLAVRNLSRQRRRTANTAAALFVALAIVGCIGVVTSSVKASVSDIVDNNLQADYVLVANSTRIPEPALEQIRQLDDVADVETTSVAMGVKVSGVPDPMPVFVTDRGFADTVIAPDSWEGDFYGTLDDSTRVVVGETTASKYGWHVGDTIELTSDGVTMAAAAQQAQQQAQEAQQQAQEAQQAARQSSRTATYTIDAIAKGVPWSSNIWIDATQADELGLSDALIKPSAFVTFRDGTDTAAARGELESIARPYYTISVMSHDEYKSATSSMVDQVMLGMYALLALSLVIAIFGIVNTLMLSISERTREIGVLRAIGTSDRQVRGMIAIESTLISIMGTVLGLVAGVAAGAEIRGCYSAMGLSVLSIPWLQLALFLVCSIAVGILASLAPARRALEVPVLDAVASE